MIIYVYIKMLALNFDSEDAKEETTIEDIIDEKKK